MSWRSVLFLCDITTFPNIRRLEVCPYKEESSCFIYQLSAGIEGPALAMCLFPGAALQSVRPAWTVLPYKAEAVGSVLSR